MPASLMAGLHNSNSNPEGATMFSPSASVVGNRARDIAQQNLTNVTMMSFRQQMDETHQMGRIADFFGTPAMPNQNLQPIQNQAHVQNQGLPINAGAPMNQVPQVAQEEPPVQVTELPRGWKIPKFTKFAGDTTESTVEHVA
ncbi:hypothetical protein L195_g052085, partial [Trifolium pratense]